MVVFKENVLADANWQRLLQKKIVESIGTVMRTQA